MHQRVDGPLERWPLDLLFSICSHLLFHHFCLFCVRSFKFQLSPLSIFNIAVFFVLFQTAKGYILLFDVLGGRDDKYLYEPVYPRWASEGRTRTQRKGWNFGAVQGDKIYFWKHISLKLLLKRKWHWQPSYFNNSHWHETRWKRLDHKALRLRLTRSRACKFACVFVLEFFGLPPQKKL